MDRIGVEGLSGFIGETGVAGTDFELVVGVVDAGLLADTGVCGAFGVLADSSPGDFTKSRSGVVGVFAVADSVL